MLPASHISQLGDDEGENGQQLRPIEKSNKTNLTHPTLFEPFFTISHSANKLFQSRVLSSQSPNLVCLRIVAQANTYVVLLCSQWQKQVRL